MRIVFIEITQKEKKMWFVLPFSAISGHIDRTSFRGISFIVSLVPNFVSGLQLYNCNTTLYEEGLTLIAYLILISSTYRTVYDSKQCYYKWRFWPNVAASNASNSHIQLRRQLSRVLNQVTDKVGCTLRSDVCWADLSSLLSHPLCCGRSPTEQKKYTFFSLPPRLERGWTLAWAHFTQARACSPRSCWQQTGGENRHSFAQNQAVSEDRRSV